jgi:hypothetical protein
VKKNPKLLHVLHLEKHYYYNYITHTKKKKSLSELREILHADLGSTTSEKSRAKENLIQILIQVFADCFSVIFVSYVCLVIHFFSPIANHRVRSLKPERFLRISEALLDEGF